MSLKRQTLWGLAPLLVISAVNLVSVPLFYRYLGTDMLALWFYVITFSGMFGFADLGLGVAVGRYIGMALGRGDHAAVREYWGTGNLIALPLLALMGLVFAVLGVTFGPAWFKVSSENVNLLRACFIAGGLSLFLNYYGQFWNILLQAHLDFKFSSLLRTGTSLIGMIASIILAWATGNPLWLTVWGVILGVLQLVVLARYSRRRFQLGFEFRSARRARVREMAAYTGKTFAALVSGALFVNIDRLVLGRVTGAAGTAEFSHYTNCSNVGARLQGLGGAVMGPVFHNTNRAVGGQSGSTPVQIYNEMFNFTFGWYLFAAVWLSLWHPVLLRLWLGHDLGGQFAPLFVPIVIAYSINAIAGISTAQLCSLNRVGTSLGFTIAAGVLSAVGVLIGWQQAGAVGVAYGFLASRVVWLVQDIYAIRMMKAGGWLEARTWLAVLVQCAIGAGFALAYLLLPRTSLWLLIPAAVHGGLVATWLSRHPLRRLFVNYNPFRPMRADAAGSQFPGP